MIIRLSKLNAKFIFFSLYISMSMMGNTMHLLGFIIFMLGTVSFVKTSYISMPMISDYSQNQFLFACFVLISYYWVDHSNLDTITTITIIVGIFEALYLVTWVKRSLIEGNNIEDFFKMLVLASFIAAGYAIINMPTSSWANLKNLFLGDYGLESHNSLGMLSAFCGGFCFYFLTTNKDNKIFYSILFALEVLITILSGSRKGFLAIALCIGAYYVLSAYNLKLIRNLIIVVILVMWGYFFLITNETLYAIAGAKLQILIQNLFIGSEIKDWSIIERSYYRTQAMNLFYNNPIFGNGINGFRAYMKEIGYSHVTYSHCNYTELLANYGLIGFLLYYFLKIKIVLKSIGKLRNKNKLFIGMWIWVVTLLILEYGFVSYYSTWAQAIWIILYLGITLRSPIEKYVN